MAVKRIIQVVVAFLLACSVNADPTEVNYNAQLNEAQQHLLALRLNKAKEIILAESYKNPNNIACDFLINYFYFFKALTSQQEADLAALKKQSDLNIKKINSLPDVQPLKKVMLAEIYLQEAFVKALFEEYLGAVMLIRSANKLLVQNKKQYPTLVANDKNLALLEALGGTLPENYQWVAQVAGMQTSFNIGIDKLLHYINNGKANKQTYLDIEQAKMLYVFLICQYSEDKERALDFCFQHFKQTNHNLFHVFLIAFAAIDAKKPDYAIKAIELFEPTPDYTTFYYIDYMYGKAKMYAGDKDAAIWFKKYVTFYKGKLLINDAYRKLSWLACLDDDFKTYKIYYQLSIKDKPKLNEEELYLGNLIAQTKMPEKHLLQSRILFDGGRYNDALAAIEKSEQINKTSERDKIELFYRKGRIYYDTGKYQNAIECFNKCMLINKKNKSYMVPYACYYLGMAHLKLGKHDLAKKTFAETLTYSGYQYENTLKQKVKIAQSLLN